MSLDPEWLIVFAAVAFVAGTVDTLAGGGGLLTIPAFLMAGLTPAQALATNKCQGVAGTLTATARLVRLGHLDLKRLWPLAILAFGASLVGAWLLSRSAGAPWMNDLIPLLLIAAALYFGWVRFPDTEGRERVFSIWAVILIALIGCYDGFFGPGTGSLFAWMLLSVMGMSLREATGHAKLFNAMTNLGAFMVFVGSDLVRWPLVAVMVPCQMLGALLGTHLILGRGIRLVRPLVVVMCLILSLKLASEAWLA